MSNTVKGLSYIIKANPESGPIRATGFVEAKLSAVLQMVKQLIPTINFTHNPICFYQRPEGDYYMGFEGGFFGMLSDLPEGLGDENKVINTGDEVPAFIQHVIDNRVRAYNDLREDRIQLKSEVDAHMDRLDAIQENWALKNNVPKSPLDVILKDTELTMTLADLGDDCPFDYNKKPRSEVVVIDDKGVDLKFRLLGMDSTPFKLLHECRSFMVAGTRLWIEEEVNLLINDFHNQDATPAKVWEARAIWPTEEERFNNKPLTSEAVIAYVNQHVPHVRIQIGTISRVLGIQPFIMDGNMTGWHSESVKLAVEKLKLIMKDDTPVSWTELEPTPELDPLDIRTAKFTPESIIFNRNGFVIARGIWEGKVGQLACRHHDGKTIGYPNGMGKPQWMFLPATSMGLNKDGSALLRDEVLLRFRGEVGDVQVGYWVRTDEGWHLVDYVYGHGDEMVSAIGLGKRDAYPITFNAIKEVRTGQSALSKWHSGKICVWLTVSGKVFTSFPCSIGEVSDYHNRFVMVEISPSIRSLNTGEPIRWSLSNNRSTLGYFYQLNELVLVATYAESAWEELFGASSFGDKAGLWWVNELDFQSIPDRHAHTPESNAWYELRKCRFMHNVDIVKHMKEVPMDLVYDDVTYTNITAGGIKWEHEISVSDILDIDATFPVTVNRYVLDPKDRDPLGTIETIRDELLLNGEMRRSAAELAQKVEDLTNKK